MSDKLWLICEDDEDCENCKEKNTNTVNCEQCRDSVLLGTHGVGIFALVRDESLEEVEKFINEHWWCDAFALRITG